MRGGAETVNAQARRGAGLAQTAVANEPCTEQRRGFDIRESARDRETKPRIGHDIFGIAAVEGVAGELRLVAEVLAPRNAEFAGAAGPAKPRHAGAVAFFERLDLFP